MNNTNLKINESCIQCGSCLGCGYSFLASEKDGAIIVNAGTVLPKDSIEFKKLQEICPVNAFEIEEELDKSKVLEELISELKKYEGIPVPTREDVKFDKEECFISRHFPSGENEYKYSSEKEAEKAALQEFEAVMYSKIDSIILNIIAEYKAKKVRCYYTADIEEGSVYAKSNKYISELLKGINNIIGNKLPSDFSNVDVMPSGEDVWKAITSEDSFSKILLEKVKNEFTHEASSYNCYWTIDCQDIYLGTDWLGGAKYKTEYCYYNVWEACEKLANDIKNACEWAGMEIEECAIRTVYPLISWYNGEIKILINKKIRQIEKLENLCFDFCMTEESQSAERISNAGELNERIASRFEGVIGAIRMARGNPLN